MDVKLRPDPGVVGAFVDASSLSLHFSSCEASRLSKVSVLVEGTVLLEGAVLEAPEDPKTDRSSQLPWQSSDSSSESSSSGGPLSFGSWAGCCGSSKGLGSILIMSGS